MLLSLYIIVTPFLPHVSLWWDRFRDDTSGLRYSGRLAAAEGQSENDNLEAVPPTENTVVIPGIQVDEAIIEGDVPGTVDLGVWRRPQTSTPDKGSNTVIVAHRFAYDSGATFYHLDKIKVGDKFAVWWEGEEYVYEVFEQKVVPATAIEIEGPTAEPIVTLYTCTPVWTAVDRLVVIARLVDGPEDVLQQFGVSS